MKNCIFCGENVSEKTKEHIIPQWLMKLTGDPNRQIKVGLNLPQIMDGTLGGNPVRQFSFKSFQFPACSKCNSAYSDLEVITKSIVEKILNNEDISVKELDVLMDWFDKIRTGLWLGFMQLNKNIANIDPKFAVDKRISSKDRMLAIYKFDHITDGINFIGSDTFVFQYLPSCFGFRINNYYFLNISFEFIFSKNLGFPFINKFTQMQGTDNFYLELKNGTNTIKHNVLPKPILEGNLHYIQPLFSSKSIIGDNKNIDENKEFYSRNEFVNNHSLDIDLGKGAIFTKKSNQSYTPLVQNEQIINFSSLESLSNKFSLETWSKMFTKMVYEYQNYLIKNYSYLNAYDNETKKSFKKKIDFSVRYNKTIVQMHYLQKTR